MPLILMHDKTDFHSQLYEIVIGGCNNTKSAIYKERGDTVVAVSDHESLGCNVSRTFWVTWEEASVHVGSDAVAGKDAFMMYDDSDPLKVNHVSVSPGNWTFYSANCGCCLQEQRFCQGLLEAGVTNSGVYNVTSGDNLTIKVYCDMETDNGGWLVFQRRQDGSEDFYRDWLDFENGFGNLNGEFWLGNRHLHSITSSGHYQLRVDLEDWEGIKAYAKYHTFIVAHKCESYKITVLGYSGTAGDALAYHNGQSFTTKDNDNDNNTSNCAKTFGGGWWYGKCHHTNLNGLYLASTNTSMSNGVTWNKWRGNHYSLKSTELKIREICKL